MFSAEDKPSSTEVEDTSVDPIAEGWNKHVDEKGRTYFFNKNSGETRWKAPAGWKEDVRTAEKTISRAEQDGWGQYEDEQGRVYYFNTITGDTQWVPPSTWVDGKNTIESDKITSLSSNVQKTSTIMLKEQGWGKHVDEKGRTYYFNATTGETLWTPPKGWEDDEMEKQPLDSGVKKSSRASILRADQGIVYDSDDEEVAEGSTHASASVGKMANRSSLLVTGEKAIDAAKNASSLAEKLAVVSSGSKKIKKDTNSRPSDLDREL